MCCNSVDAILRAFLIKKLHAKLTRITRDSEAIILLHGLARTSRCMNKAEKWLTAYGYKIINVDYPSRKHNIETLALKAVIMSMNESVLFV